MLGVKITCLLEAHWFRYLAAEPETGNLIAHCASSTALGKLHCPRMPPEEGNGKPLLNILYLENPEKGCHKSKFT